MRRLTIILILLVTSPTWAANVFTGDADVMALWRVESGALTTDTISTNTLTNINTVTASATHKEGSYGADFVAASTQYLQCANADLAAGFPWKSTGTGTGSVAFWVRFDVLPGVGTYVGLFSKYQLAAGGRSFNVSVVGGASQYVVLSTGYNSGGTGEDVATHGTDLATGVWYHVAVTYNASTRGGTIRIWDDTAGAILGSDASGTGANAIYLSTCELALGAYSGAAAGRFHDGLMDEIVVFDRVLNTTEIDQIRAGTFGATPAADRRRIIIAQ
jgi:hypothetical protein